MLELLLASAFALLAGASLVVQQALNADLRANLGSAVWAGFASYLVGLVCMTLTTIILREAPPVAQAGRASWWVWGGGLFGAIYIGLAILLVPRLGAATFIVLLVAGQMLTSVAIDHFGWLGLAQRPVDLSRAVGIVVLVIGVALIRR